MIIHRNTRPNLEFKSKEDLVEHFQVFFSEFKRFNENNESAFAQLLSRNYNSPKEFESHLKSTFGKTTKKQKLFGWTEEEIEDFKKQFRGIRKSARKNAAAKHGLTEEQYSRVLSRFCIEYWLHRGFDEETAKKKVSEVQSENSKKAPLESKRENSPRTLEYWEKRGYQDPEYQRSQWQKRSSNRSISYWIAKGFTEDEARVKVSEIQRGNANKYYDTVTGEEFRKNNFLCAEYYRERGFTESEISEIKKDLGRTFSLDICIEKYGEERGKEVWNERQKRWKESIANLSDEEKKIIREKQGRWSSFYKTALTSPTGIRGQFYIIEIGENRIKIGITSRGVSSRYKKSDLDGKKFVVYEMEDYFDSFKTETAIKKLYESTIRKDDYGPFGWTEVLNGVRFEDVVSKTEELLQNKEQIETIFKGM